MDEEKKQGKVIGLDVHPSCFTAAAFDSSIKRVQSAKPLWIQDKIPMEKFEKWLLKHTQEGDVLVLESLSFSFHLVNEFINKHNRHGIVMETFKASKIGKTYLKNDKVDAAKLAKIYLAGLEDKVWVPDENTLKLREVFFAHKKAVGDMTRASNRIWGFLSKNGVVIRSGMRALLKKGRESLLSLGDWTRMQTVILESYFDDYETAKLKRKRFESIMAETATTDPKMISLLQLFGISYISSFSLTAIIGDIKRFQNAKKLTAYIGLQPKVFDSGERTHTGGISRQGRRDVKSILIQCAKAVVRFAPKNHPLAKWGRKLKFRKNSNTVSVAVARKLVVAIWYILNGFETPMIELSQSIKTKLNGIATKIGRERREELGFVDISTFVEVKGEILLGVT